MYARTVLLLMGLLFVSPAPARAGDVAAPVAADNYAQPTLPNLVKTLVRFSALDIKDIALLDEYAMITDCELVKYFYDNDFRWNRVRAAFNESIDMNIATFPTTYQYDAMLQLDRYDFDARLFRFTDKTAVANVNAFTLHAGDRTACGARYVKYIPMIYHAVLDTPVSIPGLPFAEADAKALLKRLKENGNNNRNIYARFNLSIVYIEPLRKSQLSTEQQQYTQSGDASGGGSMRLDAHLDSVGFYEDADMTKLIYSYRP